MGCGKIGGDWIGYQRVWRDNCGGVGYKEDRGDLGFLEIFPSTTFYRHFTIPWACLTDRF